MSPSKPHTPRIMTVSGLSLWSDTPFHRHIRMAEIKEHSSMSGIDSAHIARELARRWNAHTPLVDAAWLALEQLTQWQGLDEDDEGTIEAIVALRQALNTPDST